MMQSDDHVKQLLDDLGRALAEAIASSSDVTAVAARIRGNGYALNLILNCSQQGGKPSVHAEPLMASSIMETAADSSSSRPTIPLERPAFRLSAGDVGFLKGLGIDGTRPARR